MSELEEKVYESKSDPIDIAFFAVPAAITFLMGVSLLAYTTIAVGVEVYDALSGESTRSRECEQIDWDALRATQSQPIEWGR